MDEDNLGLYNLSTGKPVSSLTRFASPADEHRPAFNRLNFKGAILYPQLQREFLELLKPPSPKP